jgi:NhaA family Na+:H+ antiporter
VQILSANSKWGNHNGCTLLAGIGFTMSLFISGLAFKNPVFINQAKYGILIASIIAGVLGTFVLKRIGKSDGNEQSTNR